MTKKAKDLFSQVGIKVERKPKTKKEIISEDFCGLVTSLCGLNCVAEYKFHPNRRWRFDYALPAVKIAIEVEGGIYSNGRHIRPSGFVRDMEKYNTAAVNGWTLIRTTPQHLYSETTRAFITTAIHNKR